jgi:CubicO group peptidase (beta-lactamase class C family)
MRLAVLLALTLLSPWEAVRAQAKPLESFDAYVTRSMADWKVPGLAVAIVRNGSVVLAKGYGVKTVGQPGRVDAATVFAIGSATKAFTATAVAMLVDEGKVRWDDPVTRHLLGFQLYDPYVTRELTVRDLLTHRSGLGSGDLIVYSENRGIEFSPGCATLSRPRAFARSSATRTSCTSRPDNSPPA